MMRKLTLNDLTGKADLTVKTGSSLSRDQAQFHFPEFLTQRSEIRIQRDKDMKQNVNAEYVRS